MGNGKDNRSRQPRKRGNRLGFWFFKTMLRLFGLRGAYGLLYPVCLYYLLFDKAAVRGALAYIIRRFPDAGRRQRRRLVYQLFLSQGVQLIDRYAAFSGAIKFDFDLRGGDKIEAALQRSDAGMVLLTAHMGNWQIAVTTLRNMGKLVHLVMGSENNEAVQRALRPNTDTEHLRVIASDGHLGGVVPIMNALNNGDIVAFMGDRPFDFEAMEVRFLGDTARFPCGAFQIAAAAGCPIQILLSARLGYRRYLVDCRRILFPAYEKGISKRAQISQWMQQYADILSEFIAEYPMQCFLFTDIWSQPPKAEP